MATPASPLLEISQVSKAYPGVQALRNVSFTAGRGEVHALLGANGAGKSTLIKILMGAVARDSGTITFEGKPLTTITPQIATHLGIACIFQDPALIPLLTVEQNIFLGHEMTRAFGWVAQRQQRERARALLAPIAPHLAPTQLVQRLRTTDRQLVALAKALLAGNRLVIMDEPTASMSETEIRTLFNAIERLKAAGVCVIYVTHRLEEVFQVADTVTVLRDGEHIFTRPVRSLNKTELINSIIGRELRIEKRRSDVSVGEPVIQVRRLSSAGSFTDISFTVHAGEIVALAGLVGSGRSEIARAILGADHYEHGEIHDPARRRPVRSPAAAVRAGLVMIPEDRKSQGIIPKMTTADNMMLSAVRRFSLPLVGWVRRARVRQAVQGTAQALELRPAGAEERLIESLSGGNQQKALIARAIQSQARLLIFDEPTAGVDVGAKAEIHHLIMNLARDGRAILLISSEIEEVLTLADRILVLRAGRIVGELKGESATSHDILHRALGEQHTAAAAEPKGST
jgi:ABC-type sugar transport system ATPase subunit